MRIEQRDDPIRRLVIADANVLLRALDRDDRAQARSVRARIETARSSDAKLTVLAATVLEVAYVLESHPAGYGWERKDVARAIAAIVDEPAFQVEHREAIVEALRTYRTRSIDLHDCYVASVATQREDLRLSFDEDLRKLGVGEEP